MERVQIETEDALRLELVGRLKVGAGWRGEAHSHQFWELLFIVSGRMSVASSEGERVVGPDSLVLLAPCETHRFVNAAEETADSLYIGCSFTSGGRTTFRQELFDAYPDRASLASRLRSFAARTDGGGKSALYALRSELPPELYILFRFICPEEETGGASGDILVSKAKSYIKSNLHRAVSVDEIAGSLYITRHYLGVTFKRLTGCTIKEYQLRQKMQKALYLVKSTELPLGEIAAGLGFDTPQYFSACFKSVYGLPPSRFRG